MVTPFSGLGFQEVPVMKELKDDRTPVHTVESHEQMGR